MLFYFLCGDRGEKKQQGKRRMGSVEGTNERFGSKSARNRDVHADDEI